MTSWIQLYDLTYILSSPTARYRAGYHTTQDKQSGYNAVMKNEPSTLGRNLKRIRKAAHMSQQRLADQAGISRSTVRDLEVGRYQNATMESIQAMAGVLQIRVTDLTDEPDSLSLPLVGIVGAGAKVSPITDCSNHTEITRVEAPPGYKDGNVAAVEVVGDSMYPVFKDGTILYYKVTSRVDDTAIVNKDCIVQVYDEYENGEGDMYCKLVKRGSAPGLYTLRSYNNPEDIEDVKLAWASPIIWTKRL